jgi:tetratricopeptide (TPR) repeat protein
VTRLSSTEAYEYYVEGFRLHVQLKTKEAIALFEKAVEVDPGFASALFRIGNCYAHLRRPEEAEIYFRRALKHLDRLSLRERYYIEAVYNYWRG